MFVNASVAIVQGYTFRFLEVFGRFLEVFGRFLEVFGIVFEVFAKFAGICFKDFRFLA